MYNRRIISHERQKLLYFIRPTSAPEGPETWDACSVTLPRPEPHRSNAAMIYVRCLSLHVACSSALERSVQPDRGSNLSPYVCRRCGAKVREMKMTRPDLIVLSICGLRQDVCLNVYWSFCPSVLLLFWRRVLCRPVGALCLHSADPIYSSRNTGFNRGWRTDTDHRQNTQNQGKRFPWFLLSVFLIYPAIKAPNK